jgi:selenoprotein W-related protein
LTEPSITEPRPHIEIEYCTRCRWLLRAAWMAQELLTTFERELGGVTLMPAREAGVFAIRLDGETLASRATEGGFPDLKALKQRVRDRIAPERDLGHTDR